MAEPSCLTRFVILAAPRTGSNWLCSLLNSHPEILCHHEIFNPSGIFYALDHRDGTLDLGTIEERDRQPLDFLERVWQTSLGFPCVGFKMTRGQDERVFQAVIEDRTVCKILLRRGNGLKTYVSELIARQTEQWEVYDRSKLPARPIQVHVDVADLRAHLAATSTFYCRLEESLKRSDQEYFSVHYERLSFPDELAALLKFVGTTSTSLMLRSPSARHNPWPLKDRVVNFDELQSTFRGTPLESLLDADEGFSID